MLKKEVILEGLVKGRDKMEEHNNVINKGYVTTNS